MKPLDINAAIHKARGKSLPVDEDRKGKVCPICDGTGRRKYSSHCSRCRGTGRLSVRGKRVPNYCGDLNAMAEAEGHLDAQQLKYTYSTALYNVVVPKDVQPFRATARQRAEAFLRTLGLWVETPEIPK